MSTPFPCQDRGGSVERAQQMPRVGPRRQAAPRSENWAPARRQRERVDIFRTDNRSGKRAPGARPHRSRDPERDARNAPLRGEPLQTERGAQPTQTGLGHPGAPSGGGRAGGGRGDPTRRTAPPERRTAAATSGAQRGGAGRRTERGEAPRARRSTGRAPPAPTQRSTARSKPPGPGHRHGKQSTAGGRRPRRAQRRRGRANARGGGPPGERNAPGRGSKQARPQRAGHHSGCDEHEARAAGPGSGGQSRRSPRRAHRRRDHQPERGGGEPPQRRGGSESAPQFSRRAGCGLT